MPGILRRALPSSHPVNSLPSLFVVHPHPARPARRVTHPPHPLRLSALVTLECSEVRDCRPSRLGLGLPFSFSSLSTPLFFGIASALPPAPSSFQPHSTPTPTSNPTPATPTPWPLPRFRPLHLAPHQTYLSLSSTRVSSSRGRTRRTSATWWWM